MRCVSCLHRIEKCASTICADTIVQSLEQVEGKEMGQDALRKGGGNGMSGREKVFAFFLVLVRRPTGDVHRQGNNRTKKSY